MVTLKFGRKATKLSSQYSSLEAIARCQGVFLEQVRLVLEQILPGKEEELLCSCSCCVQILYWLHLFKVTTKKKQLHKVLCDRFLHRMLCWEGLLFEQTSVTNCCNVIVLAKGVLSQRDLCVGLYPNQPFRERSDMVLCVHPYFLASILAICHSVSLASDIRHAAQP